MDAVENVAQHSLTCFFFSTTAFDILSMDKRALDEVEYGILGGNKERAWSGHH